MRISHRDRLTIGKARKRHPSSCRLKGQDGQKEEEVRKYLNSKLTEAGVEEGVVVNVLTFEPKAKRVNLYGPLLDDGRLSYRLEIIAQDCGLHHANWRQLTSYHRGYLVRRQEFVGDVNPNEWVALIGIPLTEGFDGEVVGYRESN